MPLPKPKPGEKKEDFEPRCMGDSIMLAEHPDEAQRFKVCQSQWEKYIMKALLILKAIDGAPAMFQLLPYGEVRIHGEPPAYVDEESMTSIIAAFKARDNDMVIDYEHQTLLDVQAPAAGWITELINKGKEGLWAATEWTDKAITYLKNREYRYFSPVFWVRPADRKVVSVEHIGLTNTPLIDGLKPIVSKHFNPKPKEEASIMIIQKLIKLFKLDADAGEDQVVAAAEAVVAKNKELAQAKEAAELEKKKSLEIVACKEVLDALKLDDKADKTAALAAIAGLGATDDVAQKLSLEVAKLKTEISEMKQSDLVALALKDGKTSPEELDSWGRELALSNPDKFELIVLSRPAGSVVPLDKIEKAPKDTKIKEGENQKLINKLMGVSEGSYKKYSPDALAAAEN